MANLGSFRLRPPPARQRLSVAASAPTPEAPPAPSLVAPPPLTFAQTVAAFYDQHRATWATDKHAREWLASLTSPILLEIGNKPIAAVAKQDVLRVVKPVWIARSDAGRRLLQRIKRVLEWAAARDLRPEHNYGMWEAISWSLPSTKSPTYGSRHFAACGYDALPAALSAIKASPAGTSVKSVLSFLILTAARSGEARLARWTDIDWSHACWDIPPEHTKRRRHHKVPLSRQALALLRQQQNVTGTEGLIFPSPRGGTLTGAALLKALKAAKVSGTVHGLRSCLRDWAAEETNYSRDIVEVALAHQVGQPPPEAAHPRSDHFRRRRQLMQDWADALLPPAPDTNQSISVETSA